MSEETDIEEDDSGSTKFRRMSDADLAAAKELYELGKKNIKELADQFGVNRVTMSKKLRGVGATYGSRSTEVAAATKAEALRFAAQQEAWVEETRVQGYSMLKNFRLLLQKIISDRVRTGAMNFELDDENIKALQRANKMTVDNLAMTLTLIKAEEYIGEDDLPILQLEDLTKEDMLEHFKSTGVLDEDATIEDLNNEALS